MTDDVIVASSCSGHGFTFAPVLGEIVADLALDGATGRDIDRFRLARVAPLPTPIAPTSHPPAQGGGS